MDINSFNKILVIPTLYAFTLNLHGLFYYLFTEVFLMIDSRAKNMFLTTFDGTHWFPIPYDMDTAAGIKE